MDCFWPKILWHVSVLFFLLSSPSSSPSLSMPSYLPSPFVFQHPPSLLLCLIPSSALSCVSLHAWLAAVIPVSPSVIRGQCRNRCIAGRYLTTQHFTGQALYHLSPLTAQWGKKNRRTRHGCGLTVWLDTARQRQHHNKCLFKLKGLLLVLFVMQSSLMLGTSLNNSDTLLTTQGVRGESVKGQRGVKRINGSDWPFNYEKVRWRWEDELFEVFMQIMMVSMQKLALNKNDLPVKIRDCGHQFACTEWVFVINHWCMYSEYVKSLTV